MKIILSIMVLLTHTMAMAGVPADTISIIEEVYQGLEGYTVSNEERAHVDQKSGDKTATYGEILPASVDKLIKILRLSNDDVFYDLGSGVGKAVMHVYVGSPVRKSVGVELSHTRHARAMTARMRLEKAGKIANDRELVFIEGSFLDHDLSDATAIFMCSTCFPDDLMAQLTLKFTSLKPGLKIATLKPLPDHPKFKNLGQHTLAMTWSGGSTLHVYELLG